MEVVAHQAIAIEHKRIAALRPRKRLQKRPIVVGVAEDGRTIIAAVEGMVHQAIGDGTRKSRHADKVQAIAGGVKKNELTPFSPFSSLSK